MNETVFLTLFLNIDWLRQKNAIRFCKEWEKGMDEIGND